ncbi:uroporphyrinogen-III C-methyltransferase [Jejubacter calystegiae]|uniref:Uroporphyrinogen-III C-methyltransferase n=1 Tax=Jejubacter calystegiae TaxID=2579935 RepID=A0A4P8YID3_9ENTR|nr:uroporphyrinogen-III C-methyltransferase [Jejubacter calystegiae]QCT19354.1 uroporphyrinogen-III C-methyltransferase [Jejubacter calystegiae]
MTEPKESSARVEEATPDVETPVQTQPQEKQKRGTGVGITLSVIAIAIALAAGAGLYTWNKRQAASQTASTQTLAAQVTALQQQLAQQKTELDSRLQQQQSSLDAAQQREQIMAKTLEETREKMASITGGDANNWLLAEADYLVKLAGRKLWSDQDVATAAALLKNADVSLGQMNDPSLIAARRALNSDIASLSGVSQIDFDGIILRVNQLSNQVDNLRLADNDSDDAPMDADSREISGSLSEWRQNLTRSWHNFMDSFITIRRRDATEVPLLAPNQDVYLRENIRSRLLVAAQAVPRHQDEVYKQSLETVATWVRAYYDTNDAATKGFLAELDALSQQSIAMELPESLASQPVLEKLMRQRVRNQMAPSDNGQPAAAGNSASQTEQQGE